MQSAERSRARAWRGVVRARPRARGRGLSAAGLAALLLVGCADFGRGEPSPPDTGAGPATVADPGTDTATDVAEVPDGADEVGATCPVAAPPWGLGEGLMLPGTECLGCHTTGQSATRAFTLAGTVFATDTCPKPALDAVVRVVDASGVTVDLQVNAAGNFYTDRALAAPWRVSLVVGDTVTPMAAPTADGRCNSCHTPAASGYISLAKSAQRLPTTNSP